MKDHLAGRRSARGLLYMPVLTEDYGGVVRVYESSAAEQPCVWLRVARGSHRPPAGEPPADIAVHLTAETAWELAEQLRYVLRHHYQGDAMPDVAEELKERVRESQGVPLEVTQSSEWQPGDPIYPSPAPEPEVMTYCSGCGQSFPGELDRCPNGCSWAECTGAIDCPADDHVPGCFGPLSGTEHPSEAGDTY